MFLSLKLCFVVSLICLLQFVQSYIPRRKTICTKLEYTTTGYKRVSSCCNGYMNTGYSRTLKCKPVCHTGCPNGRCVAPDACYCNIGYTINPATFSCEPRCSEPCYNGDCVAPETCKCRPGFRGLNATYCEPIPPQCSPSCFHGDCVGRNTCQCHDGYEPSGWVRDGFDYTCIPHITTSTTTTTAIITSVDDNEMVDSRTEMITETSDLLVTDEDQVVTDQEVTDQEVTDQEVSLKAEDSETITEPGSTTEDVNVTALETNVSDGSMTVIVYFGGLSKLDDNFQDDKNTKNSGTNIWIYISAAILLMAVVILLVVAYRRRLLGNLKGRTYVVQDQQTRRASVSSCTFNVTFSSNEK